MALVRALCIGGSWAGHYNEFDVTRQQQTFSVSGYIGRKKPIAVEGEAPTTMTFPEDKYTLRSIENTETGERIWFAVADDQSFGWALNQMAFAYAKMHTS